MSVVSTRPELIKMAPVIEELNKKSIENLFITTGQHYDFLLFEKMIKDLNMPEPDYNLTVGSGTPGIQIGISMLVLERTLEKEKPDIILAEGDTNSVLATALAAHKNNYIFGHVEAGLRSFDLTMPEESNRLLTDHISNILFAPTETSKKNLLNENIDEKRIFVTGNTIVDAVKENIPIADEKSDIMSRINEEEYTLLTLHRAENTTKEKLLELIRILKKVKQSIIFPIHPRTKKLLKFYGLEKEINRLDNVQLIEPLGYLDFLVLMKNASLILTDSGGLQEEATVLKIPTLVLRQNTERPEALGKGCELTGINDKLIKKINNPPEPKECPFGDGKSGKRIVKILEQGVEQFNFKPSNMICG